MKQIKALQDRKTTMRRKLRQLEADFSLKVDEKLKNVEFITCKNCKSRMDTRFRKKTLRCPICESSFLNQTDIAKREKLKTKIAEIDQKIANLATQNAKPIDKHAVIDEIKSLNRRGVDFNGIECATQNGVATIEFMFRAGKNDGIFYQSSKPDDDWPEFIGERDIDASMRARFGDAYQDVNDHEKGHFSVIMEGILK